MPSVDVLLDRVIPERDMRILCLCCGEQTPEFVIRDYWEYKRIRDRHDASLMQPWEFTYLVFAAYKRCEQPIHDNPARPYDVLKILRRGDIKIGDLLRVHWRGVEQKGEYIDCNYAGKTVTLIIDSKERTVSASAILGPFEPQPAEA